MTKRVLTGIKSTGVPHLGNFLGAIQPCLDLAKSLDGFFFIADLHALTTSPDPKEVLDDVYTGAATWLALGLDPAKATFYRQSDVPEVPELAWVLSCVAPMGLLKRAHTFKELRDNQGVSEEDVKLGLFSYPVLMAADILAFDADVVPVGKDQKQHLEICQELCRKINDRYGEGVLTRPEAQIDERVMTVPGLDGRKMSKSYDNGIPLFLPKKQMKKRVAKIVTNSAEFGDPLPMTTEDPETPETTLALFRLLAQPEQVKLLEAQYKSGRKDPAGPDEEDNYFGWGHAKGALHEQLEARFGPARDEYEKLLSDRGHIDDVLNAGAVRAREVASQVLDRVRRAVGLRSPGA